MTFSYFISHANPIAFEESPGKKFNPSNLVIAEERDNKFVRKLISMANENVLIRVHPNYSEISGEFRFLTVSDGPYLKIEIPIFIWAKQKDYKKLAEYSKAKISCGSYELSAEESKRDIEFSSDPGMPPDIEVMAIQFTGLGKCPIDSTLHVSYIQQNFNVGGDATSLYMPIIPDRKFIPDAKFKIKFISDNLSLSVRHNTLNHIDLPENAKILEFTPVDHEIIEVEYGRAGKFNLKPIKRTPKPL